MLKSCPYTACEASMVHVMVRQHAFISGTLYVFYHFLHQLFGHTNNAYLPKKKIPIGTWKPKEVWTCGKGGDSALGVFSSLFKVIYHCVQFVTMRQKWEKDIPPKRYSAKIKQKTEGHPTLLEEHSFSFEVPDLLYNCHHNNYLFVNNLLI